MTKVGETCNVRVAVRCRPFNERERGTSKCLEFVNDSVRITTRSAGSSSSHTFTFDFAYDVDVPQHRLFVDIGSPVVQAAFDGFNACIFAYGQTGSGKSFAMMGPPAATGSLGSVDVTSPQNEFVGLIPRIISSIFDGVEKRMRENLEDLRADKSGQVPKVSFEIDVTYLEIYQERVFCLLDPTKQNLKVRQHPTHGVFVENLTKERVTTPANALARVDRGNTNRQTSATAMNERSSRSHAVFSIMVTQIRTSTTADGKTTTTTRKSQVNLVDLAGSERAKSTGAEGDTLKEGASINQSLTTLGLVISGLAESGTKPASFIPYRNSQLTFVLKENLGGNSKTYMLSTLSPSEINAEETLSTLRYADRAKAIKMKAFVNEDTKDKMIRELQTEILKYKKLLEAYQSQAHPVASAAARSDMSEGGDQDSYWIDRVPQSLEELNAMKHQVDIAEELIIDEATAGSSSTRNEKYFGPYLLNVEGAGSWVQEPLLPEGIRRKDVVFGSASPDDLLSLWKRWLKVRRPGAEIPPVKIVSITSEGSPHGFSTVAAIHAVVVAEVEGPTFKVTVYHLGDADFATFINDGEFEVDPEPPEVSRWIYGTLETVDFPVPPAQPQRLSIGHTLQIGSEFVYVKLKEERRAINNSSDGAVQSRLLTARKLSSLTPRPSSGTETPPPDSSRPHPVNAARPPLVPSLALGKSMSASAAKPPLAVKPITFGNSLGVPELVSHPTVLSSRQPYGSLTPRDTPRSTALSSTTSAQPDLSGASAASTLFLNGVDDYATNYSHTFALVGDVACGKSALLQVTQAGDLGFFQSKKEPVTTPDMGCTICHLRQVSGTPRASGNAKADLTFIDICGQSTFFSQLMTVSVPETRTSYLLVFPLDGRGGGGFSSEQKAIDAIYYKKYVEAIQLRSPAATTSVIIVGTFRDQVTKGTPFLSQQSLSQPASSNLDDAVGQAMLRLQKEIEQFWVSYEADDRLRPKIVARVAFSSRDRTASIWTSGSSAPTVNVGNISDWKSFLADHAFTCSKRDQQFQQGLIPHRLLRLCQRLRLLRDGIAYTNESRLLPSTEYKRLAREVDRRYDSVSELHPHTMLLASRMELFHFHRNPRLKRYVVIDPVWFLSLLGKLLAAVSVIQKQLVQDRSGASVAVLSTRSSRSMIDANAVWDAPATFSQRYQHSLGFNHGAIRRCESHESFSLRSLSRGVLTMVTSHLIFARCLVDDPPRPSPASDCTDDEFMQFVFESSRVEKRHKGLMSILDSLEKMDLVMPATRLISLAYHHTSSNELKRVELSNLQVVLSCSVPQGNLVVAARHSDPSPAVPMTPRSRLAFFQREAATPAKPPWNGNVPALIAEDPMLYVIPGAFTMSAPKILAAPSSDSGSVFIDTLLSGPTARFALRTAPPSLFFSRLVSRLAQSGKGVYVGSCGKMDASTSGMFTNGSCRMVPPGVTSRGSNSIPSPFWNDAAWVVASDTTRLLVRMSGTRTILVTLHEWSNPFTHWARDVLDEAAEIADESEFEALEEASPSRDVDNEEEEEADAFYEDCQRFVSVASPTQPPADDLKAEVQGRPTSDLLRTIAAAIRELTNELPGMTMEEQETRYTQSGCESIHQYYETGAASPERSNADEWVPLGTVPTASWPLRLGDHHLPPLLDVENWQGLRLEAEEAWTEEVIERVADSCFLSKQERECLTTATRQIAVGRSQLIKETHRQYAKARELRAKNPRFNELEKGLSDISLRHAPRLHKALVEEATALDMFVDACGSSAALLHANAASASH